VPWKLPTPRTAADLDALLRTLPPTLTRTVTSRRACAKRRAAHPECVGQRRRPLRSLACPRRSQPGENSVLATTRWPVSPDWPVSFSQADRPDLVHRRTQSFAECSALPPGTDRQLLLSRQLRHRAIRPVPSSDRFRQVRFTDYDTRVAGYAVVIDAQERILLSWYNGAGRDEPGWTLPGGGVDYTETVEAAIVREVREETGYDVALGRPLVIHSFTDSITRERGPGPSRPFKSVRIVYLASVRGGSLGTLEVSGTTDYAAWLPLSEAMLTDSRADIIDIAVAALQKARAREGIGCRDTPDP
jgi:8-oxo-dGTP diphosphatase